MMSLVLSALAGALHLAGEGWPAEPVEAVAQRVASGALPSVTAHGMGDSCFNAGMKQITELVANTTGSYARCIATGGNVLTDTTNGFLMTMNHNVDKFNENIQKDP